MADRLPPQPRRPLAADIPTGWLNAEWWQAFDTDALAVYISALMWSMGQGTDGDVSLSALQRDSPLWRDDARFAAAVAGIVAQGRGMVSGVRLILDDWEGKHAQTLHARIVRRRSTSAKSSSNYRDKHAGNGDEWDDESRDESHTVRHGKDGKDGKDGEGEERKAVEWNVVPIPDSGSGRIQPLAAARPNDDRCPHGVRRPGICQYCTHPRAPQGDRVTAEVRAS